MSGETILVVDDGKENRDFIVEYVLQPNGFRHLVARDGLEGMELARKYHPDLMLLDLQMPNMNGMEVLDALLAEQLDIPVILMTFHGSEEVLVDVYRKGVKDYVKKPYTVEEMYEAIDRSLATVRLRREKDQLTERLIEANANLSQRVRELNVIYNVGKRVTALLEIETLMGHIVEAAASLTSCEECSIYLLETERMICRAIRRQGEQRTFTINEEREDPLALRAIQMVEMVVLSILKLNHAADWDDVQRELRLAVRVRAGSARPIVKAHGGGYRDWQLWTEEYVPGLTLDRLVERLLREKAGDLLEGLEAPGGRLPEVWPFLVSACASLVVEFWRRTGRRHRLARPNPAKVVLPEHDWQVGGRLVSVADRIPCSRLTDVLDSIHRYIVHPLEERHREIALPSSWSLLFSAALEVLGEKEGMELLEAEAPWSYGGADLPGPTPELPRDGERMGPAALRFVSSVKRRGFLPTRIRMAARRWRRWEQLNPSATLEAQATTLDQFVEAYGLADLESERPGTTLQLFRHTVFRGAGEELAAAIDELIAKTVTAGAAREEWRPEVARLRERLALDDRQEFFLARMIYPHVDPRGRAVLVREEDARGVPAAGVEVEHRDPNGEVFRIRRPANPNETNALIRIFRASNFRRVPTSPDHDLLVALDDTGRVIGGVIFRRPSATFVVLEWIVVSRYRRGRGIGTELLRDFLERLKVQGVRAVSTGFFRPGFFAQFGFGVDPRYAGIVKILADPSASDSGVMPNPLLSAAAPEEARER